MKDVNRENIKVKKVIEIRRIPRFKRTFQVVGISRIKTSKELTKFSKYQVNNEKKMRRKNSKK